MDIEEIIDFINKKAVDKYQGTFENFLGENKELNNYKFTPITIIEEESHRWFNTGVGVYFVRGIDNLPIGYIGILEVTELKSESMGIEDCFIDIEAYKVNEILVRSFKIVE